MALRLVTGPPNAGKTGRVYKAVRDVMDAGGRAILLLPSGPDVMRARDEFASDAAVGLRIEQFDRFAESEWARRGDGRRIVGGFQRAVLLGEALAEAGLGDVPQPGTSALLGKIAARASESGAPRGVRPPGVAGALLTALDAYRARLDSCGLVELSEVLRLLIAEPPDADLVAVHRFADLTVGQECLVQAWGPAGLDVVVTLPWAEGLPGTESLTPLVQRMCRAGAVLESVPFETGNGELEELTAGMFAGPFSVTPSGAVRAGLAQGDEAEARTLVRYVREWIAAGVPCGRIAVIFRDPARHVGELRRAFVRAGIRAEFDVHLSMIETPLGAALKHLWSFATGGVAEELVAFARTPFSGLARADCDVIDRALRSGKGVGRATARAPLLMRLASGARRLADLPIGESTARDWKELVGRLLQNAHPGDSPVAGRAGAIDGAVQRAFFEGLDEALDLGEGRVPARDLWALFARGSAVPHAADPIDAVLITSVGRLGARRYDAIAIGGLTAAEFPRLGREDRLQGDAVRRALSAIEIDPGGEDDAGAERLSFYLAATRARRFLGLVMQETDGEGRALRPSVFWDEFLDLYRETGGPSRLAIGREDIGSGDVPTGLCARVRPTERGVIEERAAAGLLSRRTALSAGEIEAYADCPYRWYHDFVVRPARLETVLDPMAAGSAAHRALAVFYERWRIQLGNARVTPALSELAIEIASQAADEAIAALPEPTDLDQQQMAASIRTGVLSIVERDASFLPGYVPQFVEWAFGSAEGDDGVDLGGVRVKGRADRIDTGPQGLVVIDYKRSSASSLARITSEGRLQLQLYALAASERLGLPIAGGLYRRLDRPDDRGFVMKGVPGEFKAKDVIGPDRLQEVLEAAIESARSVARGIRDLRIEPSADARGCQWCAAAALCGIAHA